MVVQCAVCKVTGIYEVDADERGQAGSEWGSMECFFTPGCAGHIWPEAAN